MADILDKITRYKLDEIAHAKAATPLRVISELARNAPRERPDLMVYVLEADIGVVEVHADDSAT